MAILPSLQSPADLRTLDEAQLTQLCAEIRTTIIETVAKTGGHLGSSLGVVELTVALHRLLDSPTDRIVWDTGHQAYPHKLLTGRFERFGTLRSARRHGRLPAAQREPARRLRRRPRRDRASRSAKGLALARDARGTERADRGRGRRRGPHARALGRGAQRHRPPRQSPAHHPERQRDEHLALGRRAQPIPQPHQALGHLARLRSGPTTRTVERIPVVGHSILDVSRRFRGAVVDFAQHGQLFEDLGITYIGPVPGHDLQALDAVISGALLGRRGRSSSTCAPRRARATGRPRPTRSASTARRCRRWRRRRDDGAGATVGGDGEPRRRRRRRRRRARRPPNYTAVVAGELIAIAETTRAWWPSPRACPPAPG